MKELATVALTLASVTAMAEAWKPDAYPISYWLGPPDAFLTDKVVGEIAELSFTVSLAPGQGRLFRLDRDIPWASLPPVLRSFPIRFHDANDARAWQGLHSVTSPRIVKGALTFRVTGSDPYLSRSRLRIPAATCPVLVLRMRKEAGAGGQVFWCTATEPRFSDERFMNYETVADGAFHDIRVPVGTHPGWTGTITAIRIDPDIEGTPGAVAIESISAATGKPGE